MKVFDNNFNELAEIEVDKGLMNIDISNEGGIHFLYYQDDALLYKYMDVNTLDEINVDLEYNTKYNNREFLFDQVGDKVYISSILTNTGDARVGHNGAEHKALGAQLSVVDLSTAKEVNHTIQMFGKENIQKATINLLGTNYDDGIVFLNNKGVEVVKGKAIQVLEQSWHVSSDSYYGDDCGNIFLVDFDDEKVVLRKRSQGFYYKVYSSVYVDVYNDQLYLMYNNVMGKKDYMLNQVLLDEDLSVVSEHYMPMKVKEEAIGMKNAFKIGKDKTMFMGKKGKDMCPVILAK